MDLKEFQQEAVGLVDVIDEKYEMKHDDKFTLMHLMEEMGELAREIHNKETNRKGGMDKGNLEEEFGDLLILLAKIAENNDVDLQKAVQKKFEVLRKRHDLK